MESDEVGKDGARAIRTEPLASHHDVASFDCGIESLNVYLQRHAFDAPRHGLSQTWVTVDERGRILAYYTLSVATVTRQQAPERASRGIGGYDIPCVLLARLAVDKNVQGQGLGSLVLEMAMRKAVALGRRPLSVDNEPGLPMRAMLVHALDDNAAAFYRHHGFEASPTDPLHLLILLKDIAAALGPD